MIGTSALSLLLIFFGYLCMYLMKVKQRTMLLLVMSVLYGLLLNQQFFSAFLVLLILNYTGAKSDSSPGWTKFLVVVNLAVWIIFKIKIISGLFLPLGFSIFIFQQITWLLAPDELKKRAHFKEYALYSLFLGNIATGPLLDFKQFIAEWKGIFFESSRVYLAMTLFGIGFFKKIVLADSAMNVSGYLFTTDHSFTGNLLIPFLLNKYQIYLNFLAFSEMAIGVGLLFNIRLNPNFNRPFATTSIAEFWKRWHMTLIAWIREYVFYPIVVSPLGRLGPWFAVCVTFIVFGLWHNFTLNHLIYALIQFVLIFLESKLSKYLRIENAHFMIQKTVKAAKWLWFYVFMISIPALFFQARTISDVKRILINLISTPVSTAPNIFDILPFSFLTMFLLVVLNELIESRLSVERFSEHIRKCSWIRKGLYLALYVLIIFYFGMWEETGNFIYSTF